MASGWHNRAKYNLAKKLMDMSGDTIKVMLLANTYTFNADHNVPGDVNSNEISGTGYSAGGVALTTKTVTQDDTNDLMKFDADDSSWTTATFTARFATIWDDTIATDDLILTIDFGSDKTVTAGTFTITWSANGIARLT